MKISTKGRYALRLMLDLSLSDSEGPISLSEIASRQAISEKYSEQIISQLNRAGLVTSIRGAGGGYRLNKAKDEISVGDILRVTEGDLSPVGCVSVESDDCPREKDCATIKVWKRLNDAINNVVDSITLKDLSDWSDEDIGKTSDCKG